MRNRWRGRSWKTLPLNRNDITRGFELRIFEIFSNALPIEPSGLLLSYYLSVELGNAHPLTKGSICQVKILSVWTGSLTINIAGIWRLGWKMPPPIQYLNENVSHTILFVPTGVVSTEWRCLIWDRHLHNTTSRKVGTFDTVHLPLRNIEWH